MHLFTAIQIGIQTIDNKLDNTEKTRPTPEENDYTLLAHFLPMNNIESINHFEVLIKTDLDSVAQFVSTISFKFFLKIQILYN